MVAPAVISRIVWRIKAGEFNARCLEIIDRVAATGASVIVAQRDRPIVRLSW